MGSEPQEQTAAISQMFSLPQGSANLTKTGLVAQVGFLLPPSSVSGVVRVEGLAASLDR